MPVPTYTTRWVFIYCSSRIRQLLVLLLKFSDFGTLIINHISHSLIFLIALCSGTWKPDILSTLSNRCLYSTLYCRWLSFLCFGVLLLIASELRPQLSLLAGNFFENGFGGLLIWCYQPCFWLEVMLMWVWDMFVSLQAFFCLQHGETHKM